jgi:threonyl-tRNA synthetase
MTPIETLRHSSAHILAAAVLRHFPEAKLDIGPPTATGFYYDFDLPHRFTPEDLQLLEGTMQAIIAEDQAFQRSVVSREQAQSLFAAKDQPYKLQRLADIPQEEAITLYQNGEFVDLCAGDHLERTGQVPAFKLLSIAGAYYRGNEKNPQLQRIYGTAFPSQTELHAYLHQLEEAKKRDHRKLGKELELFHIDDEVGPGLILWTPKGAALRQALQDFISQALHQQGYEQVFTPHIGRVQLYQRSGHFPYYQDSQFSPILEKEVLPALAREGCTCAQLAHKIEQGDIDGYLLKPMNCPMHIKIFDSKPRSYRDLPVRLAEFGTVYRWEQSGELSGMTRVRGFTQDDAHLFCTPEQVPAEVQGCLELVQLVLGTLGMTRYQVRLGLRDPDSQKYSGTPQQWDAAEAALKAAVQKLGVPYTEEPGEAAFYGPKIDFVVQDVIGRRWQLGTIQLDYQLPQRFGLSYTGPDNQPHTPVMIHRAPFGSMERFCGVMIEHFAGNFPVWLAPEQVRILTVAEAAQPYGHEVLSALKAQGLRVTLDASSDKLGAKIRKAETQKVPYMLVLGEKEASARSVAVRSRLHKAHEGTVPLDAFIHTLQHTVHTRQLPEAFAAASSLPSAADTC